MPLLGGCLALVVPAPGGATVPGVNGKIAFTSTRDGNADVYAMNPDGTALTRLTNNEAYDFQPTWSPDGSKIAFTSDRDGYADVYVMNADGTGQTRLTTNAAWDEQPTWSPDGSKIALTTSRDGNAEVYVMNADGTGQTNMTNNPAWDIDPTWSPDGSKIALTTSRDGGHYEVYVMNADGTGQTRLTNNAVHDGNPAWSPDGSKIAFTTNRGEGYAEIYVMNADGTGQTNMTNNAATSDFEPHWSPDGSKIAFTSIRGVYRDVYVMNADGTGQTNMTNHAAIDFQPSWQTIPSADLAISLAATPDTVRSGKELTYTINVRDFGPSNALGVVVTDKLAPEARFVSASTQGGSCQTPAVGSTGTVTCKVGFVPNGGSRDNQIVIKVVAPKRSSITNTASVTADTPDPNPGNNTATIATPVR